MSRMARWRRELRNEDMQARAECPPELVPTEAEMDRQHAKVLDNGLPTTDGACSRCGFCSNPEGRLLGDHCPKCCDFGMPF